MPEACPIPTTPVPMFSNSSSYAFKWRTALCLSPFLCRVQGHAGQYRVQSTRPPSPLTASLFLSLPAQGPSIHLKLHIDTQ